MSKQEVSALLKARNALLWVVTPEEGRVERALIEAAGAVEYDVRLWDCVGGVTDAAGKEISPGRNATDPAVCLAAVRDSRERTVWIMRDLHVWSKDPSVQRALRNLARSLPSTGRNEARAIIVTAPTADIPPELSDHAIVVKWPLPARDEIARIFDNAINVLESLPDEYAAAKLVRDDAIDAAVGLSAEAAASCYARSLVTQGKKIVPAVVAGEKKRVISGKGLEWFDPDPRGLGAVGGLDNLKNWLTARSQAFTQRARDFGLPAPRGVLCVGLPGTGKSLMAKSIATAWQMPLLKLDLGGAKSKWVGESESNLRAALAIAEAVGRCVCWLDEVDKALGGASQGAADGGVSSDALGTLLSWMQERKGQVFVIATANDVRSLPPEMLRKGRFDEVFWVDLPTARERGEILSVAMKQYGRDASTVDVPKLVAATEGFVGSEIAAIVPAALFQAFADGERVLTTDDLLIEARNTVPLSKTSEKKVTELREWAKSGARPASPPEVFAATGSDRKLDL